MRVRAKISVLYQLVRILEDPTLDPSSFMSISRLVRTTAHRLRSEARMELIERLNKIEWWKRSAGILEATRAGLRAFEMDDYSLFDLARLSAKREENASRPATYPGYGQALPL